MERAASEQIKLGLHKVTAFVLPHVSSATRTSVPAATQREVPERGSTHRARQRRTLRTRPQRMHHDSMLDRKC